MTKNYNAMFNKAGGWNDDKPPIFEIIITIAAAIILITGIIGIIN